MCDERFREWWRVDSVCAPTPLQLRHIREFPQARLGPQDKKVACSELIFNSATWCREEDMDMSWHVMEQMMETEDFLVQLEDGQWQDDDDIGMGLCMLSSFDYDDIEEDDSLWTDVDGHVPNLGQKGFADDGMDNW